MSAPADIPGRDPAEDGPPPAAAALPALLLPVRIEARFGGTPEAPELWVRVYPDQIAIDTHDPRFTGAEVESTQRYWEALWRAGEDDEEVRRGAWQALAQRHGARRAAYLVHAEALAPSNLPARPAQPTPEGQDPSPPPAFAPLGAEQRRESSWARAPRAAALPERWTVVLERDGVAVKTATGAAIADGLAFGPTPDATPEPTPEGLAIDAPMRWMVDFDEAVAVGMGLRIEIGREDLAAGFDRVLAYGLRPSAAGGSGPKALLELFEAHRFSDGLELVRQGAATNNTVDGPAQTRSDPGFARSFRLEGGVAPTPRDGQVLAEALGLPPGSLARADGADGSDQLNARWMALALWPATGDYFLEQMLAPSAPGAPEAVGPEGREQARAYVLDRVRARGPLPAIRVGETPYGVLPATAPTMLRSKRLGAVAERVAAVTGRAWPIWLASAAGAPHVQRSGDPDQQLVSVLGMDASAQAYRVRFALGEEFVRYSLAWLDVEGQESGLLDGPGKSQLEQLGYDEGDPRLVHLALSAVDRLLTLPIVDEAPLSEEHGLPEVPLPNGGSGNYISWLRQAPLASIRDDAGSFPGGTPPKALLYKVLRQALLSEYARGAKRILVDAELADRSILRESELVGFEHFAAPEADVKTSPATALPRPNAWQALAQPMPGQGERTIADYLAASADLGLAEAGHLGELLEALDWLAGLPTAELRRLFTETLDLFSHRLDAWVISLATELDRSRQGEGPRDLHLGGYGWLEDLRPKPRPPGPSVDEAGFVHAPSLAQARTAAVLRSGYLSHRESSDGRLLAVDLSSRRVRTALELLEGIRQGQSLGALLGYRFERGLADASLQLLVQPFRDRFPVIANSVTEPPAAAEAVAASGVVDGRALHTAWGDGSLWSGPPALSPSQRPVVEGLLADLDEVLDAVGDVSIAESVHQIMRGNPVQAGGLLDAVSRGERPGEPEVVRTPRGGIDLTHRLAVLFTPGPARGAGWPPASSPRSLAEPRLDDWASAQLPHPDRVRCRVRYSEAGAEGVLDLSLADLGLGPLDALELALADDEPQASELEQRLLYLAQRQAGPGASGFEIAFDPDPGWPEADRSFPEFLVAARAVRDLIGGARPLTPQDLIEPERQAAAAGAVLDTAELGARASALQASLRAAIEGLASAADAAGLRAAILTAGLFGVVGPVPVAPVGEDVATVESLRGQAEALGLELGRRLSEIEAADSAFDSATAPPEALAAHLTGLVQAGLGAGFVVCPRFTPPAAADLHIAFGSTAALLAGQRDARERWLAQLTRVRTRVAHFAAAREAAWLFGRRLPREPKIAQLPLASGERWLGLGFDPSQPPPTGGRVSILADVEPGHSATEPHCGLLVDEWVERVPVPEQDSGLGFHYDQPSARAPQCLLLAVCPDDRAQWDDEALRGVIGETLDLAKARAVDVESLAGLGQLLPALYFPFNPDDETVSLQVVELR